MPTRSSGCLTCRKRKIRCDEGRPGCQRCATHGVLCPGYGTDKKGGIEFKDQTNSTVKRAEKQYTTKALRLDWETRRPSNKSSSSTSSESPESDIQQNVGTPQTQPSTITDSSDTFFTSADDGLPMTQSLVFYNNNLIASPTRLPSPAAERAKLYDEFINIYLPKSQQGAQNGHFSFYQTIALKRSDQPALQQGFDALSLVQIGSLYNSKPLLKEAVRQYGLALRSLASSIARREYMHDDDVLAAVTVLACCELYEEIANTGEGWAKHVQGSNQLVAARGPDSIKSNLALLLYSNMRHGGLLYALISRKAPFMAAPEWRKVAWRVPRAGEDSSTYFYDVAMQIPGVLERHDAVDMESPTAVEDIDEILADSMDLESQMRQWYKYWQSKAMFDNVVVYELRPIHEFPTFTSLCSDRTFDKAFMFPDFLVAYLHSLYWMLMHELRKNIQSLQKLRHKILKDWYPEEDDVVPESELLGYVLNLCQCIPYFVEPVSNSTGSIGIFLPMRTAALYFTAQGHWHWLKWIGSVRNSVFVRGLSPPNVKGHGKESGIANKPLK